MLTVLNYNLSVFFKISFSLIVLFSSCRKISSESDIEPCNRKIVFETLKIAPESSRWIPYEHNDTLRFQNEVADIKKFICLSKNVALPITNKKAISFCSTDSSKIVNIDYSFQTLETILEDIDTKTRFLLYITNIVEIRSSDILYADLLSVKIQRIRNSETESLLNIIIFQRTYPEQLESYLFYPNFMVIQNSFQNVYINSTQSPQVYFNQSKGIVGFRLEDDVLYERTN
ncbi:MAG: hypothetical protein WAS56_15855 [Saprospiraceae bacterium]|nr:hypothetical protein [Saprospiraceae bacterium]